MLTFAWLDRLSLDLRHSLRVLTGSPVFTAVAVLSLALGIGANTAIFSIVYAVMLKALPVEEPQRLVQFSLGERQTSISNPIWEAIRDRQQVFDGAFAYAPVRLNLATGGEKRMVDGMYVSGDFFHTLGVPAAAGRTITRDDDRRGGGTHGPVAVLSHAFWRDRYDASPTAIGSPIRLDGHTFTIVGVTPAGFSGVSPGSRFDVAVPLAANDIILGKDSRLDRRTTWWLRIMARLKPEMSREQAEAGLRTVQAQVREATMPADYRPKDQATYLEEPFVLIPSSTGPSSLRTRYQTALLTLMGAVGLVLLIACANLANLLLARAAARRKEFAVRLALGASRARLVRQLLTESLLLAVAGAALGLVFAQWANRLIVRQMSGSTGAAIFLDLTPDWSVLGFTIGVAALTAIVFGLAPAFRSTDLGAHALIKGSSRSVTSGGWRGFGLEKALVVVQIAFSLVLVFGAALFVRSFASLATLDPGFDQRQVLVVSVDARRANYPTEQRRVEYERLLDALRGLPGVHSAASTMMTPITGSVWTSTARVRGMEALSERDRRIHMNRVSPGYFATLGTPILGGRDFSAQDTREAPTVAIVNEAFVRKFFNGKNPVGQTFGMPDNEARRQDLTKSVEIVGLVKDSKYANLREAVPPTVFVAATQEREPDNYPTFVLRGPGETAALMRGVAGAVRAQNADLALEFRVFDTLVKESMMQERLIAMLSGFFGGLALLVAGIGLYGTMSLAVARRRNEIGIRMALGALPASVIWMVLRDVAIVTLIGIAIGAISGVLSGRLIATLLFGLEPSDVTTWALAIAALAAAAGVAGYLPARRAARLDPMLALREE